MPNPERTHEAPPAELPIDIVAAREAVVGWLEESVEKYNTRHPDGPRAVYLHFQRTDTFAYLQPQQKVQTFKLARKDAHTTIVVWGTERSTDEISARQAAGLNAFLGFVSRDVVARILHQASIKSSGPTVSK